MARKSLSPDLRLEGLSLRLGLGLGLGLGVGLGLGLGSGFSACRGPRTIDSSTEWGYSAVEDNSRSCYWEC
eukprot:1331907-Amorphochlora_amoeboformis.AAC.1